MTFQRFWFLVLTTITKKTPLKYIQQYSSSSLLMLLFMENKHNTHLELMKSTHMYGIDIFLHFYPMFECMSMCLSISFFLQVLPAAKIIKYSKNIHMWRRKLSFLFYSLNFFFCEEKYFFYLFQYQCVCLSMYQYICIKVLVATHRYINLYIR